MSNVVLVRFSNPEDLAESVAREFLSWAAKGPQGLSVALSGGRIADRFFSAVAAMGEGPPEGLAGVQFFWADERCVRPDDPDSNYRLAREGLLAPLGIPEGRIHRIRGEEASAQAARSAEAELRRFAVAARGQPVLDLILLGMGEDGHIASLFPGEPDSVIQSGAVYRAVTAPKPPPARITIGYPALLAARAVWVLASGSGKSQALEHSLSPASNTPLARVLQGRTSTTVFTDILENR
jgi:6-phosphogluconolactonase